MAGARPQISTHVLDSATGDPAPGVHVRVVRVLADGGEVEAGSGTTDEDGRIRELLEGDLTAGDYRLLFDLTDLAPPFFLGVRLELRIDDAGRSYHVPLLMAPYAVTTYRGS